MYRALIVEDERLMREYLASRLSEIHPDWVAAETASDGIEAVEKLDRARFDAVITDIRMPGMDGLELARYIRREHAGTDVIILSGYDEFQYAREAVRLSVFDYLLKPLNDGELSAALSGLTVRAARRHGREAGPSGLLARALGGDAAALAELHGGVGERLGLMALAPSAQMVLDGCGGLAREIFTEVSESLGPLCVLGGSGETYAVCPAREAALLTTACENKLRHFCATHPQWRLCAAYAPIGESASKTVKVLRRRLRVALATAADQPVGELMYMQRRLLDWLDGLSKLACKAAAAGEPIPPGTLLAPLADYLGGLEPGAAESSVLLLLMEGFSDRPEEVARVCRDIKEKTDGWNGPCGWFSEAWRRLAGGEGVAAANPAAPSALSQQALEYLRGHYREPISLSQVAEALHVSAAYLSDLFHRETGESYSRCLLRLRMEDAAFRLKTDPAARVYEIGEAVGFPSSKHFAHVFRNYYRMTPKEYRERGGRALPAGNQNAKGE